MSIQAADFLTDHVIGGNAVLPTTCALAWLVKEAVGQGQASLPITVRDYKLFKGVIFGGKDRAPVSTLLHFDIEQQYSAVAVKVFSKLAKGRVAFHYQGTIKEKTLVQRHVYHDVDLTLVSPIEKEKIYQGLLFHGASLQGLEKVLHFSEQGLTVKCNLSQLDEAQLGEFASSIINPVADDLVLQTLVLWPRLIMGKSALPNKFNSWTFIKAIDLKQDFYISMNIVKSSAVQVVADLVVHDEKGIIFNEVQGVVATISERLNEQFLDNKISVK